MKRFFLFIFFNCSPKKIGITLCFTLCILNCALSQNPLLKMWDKRFGGTNDEHLYSILQTSDGGFILAGYSASVISGDKTQMGWGSSDYWIVKTDSLGNKVWDKDFGGTISDNLTSIQPTTDGGFILGGYSSSGISGVKTQAGWGGFDYWIVKIDSLGNKLWDRDFGGTNDDQLHSIQQTADGGFILGGFSYSGVGGDKTQPLWGNSNDYWVIKTDSLGNKLWDKDFGGTSDDDLYFIRQTFDGGFILGGYSGSGISGDKTQPSWGGYDYWILKTDSLGNKLWDEDFGGNSNDMLSSMEQTADGGFILGGVSWSGISGDKTQASWNNSYDCWIIKTDSFGIKEWDKDIGGNNDEDEFGKVTQTPDGGYLIAGTSYSMIGGNKTENNLGAEQSWVLKTDSIGSLIWDKTLFTSAHDEQSLAIQTRDGCYLMANNTGSGIGGYKTQSNWDTLCVGVACTPDFWIIKFCDSTLVPVIAFASPTFLCPGTCTNFTNLSINATTYQWSFSGATPPMSTDVNPTNICYATPGTYDVQLIASNANGSDTLLLTNYITVFPSPPPQSITQSGDTLFAIAASASYQWYFNGNIINGATYYFYVAPASGDYNVVATDANGCEVEAAVFNVVASAQFEVSSLRFEAYPNPVGEKLSVIGYQLPGAAVGISVYNLLGEMILAVQPQTSNFKPENYIDVSMLQPGLYFLQIKTLEKTFRSKFVKR